MAETPHQRPTSTAKSVKASTPPSDAPRPWATSTSLVALASSLSDLAPDTLASMTLSANEAAAVPAPVAAAALAVIDHAPVASKFSINKQETTMSSTTTITTEDFVSQGQANVEAFVKSGQIWANGVQEIGRTLAESVQAQFEHGVATWKALTGMKSLKEAFDLQSTRTRAAVEKAVADGGKLTDASMRLAEQTMAPITARLSIATDKFVRPN